MRPSPVCAETTAVAAGQPSPARNRSAASCPAVVQQVGLVDDHDGGPLEELGAERAELAADRVERHRPRVGAVPAVEHVQQQRRALDVRQEAVPEPGALAGALDEPGDVGDHGRPLAEVQHAEVGVDGRERVRGDLGVRPRQRREQ